MTSLKGRFCARIMLEYTFPVVSLCALNQEKYHFTVEKLSMSEMELSQPKSGYLYHFILDQGMGE